MLSKLTKRYLSTSRTESLRLVTFESDGLARVGVQAKLGEICDISAIDPEIPTEMKQFLAGGSEMLTRARNAVNQAYSGSEDALISRNKYKLLAPLYNPEKILCVGMNYTDHCTEQNFPIPEEPIIFNKFPGTIIADEEDIIHDLETEELDFEVELVVVIGKPGKKIKRENAMEHVAGYTVAHDVSARDWQMRRNGGQWLLGKTFDTFCPLGPCIITPEDLSFEEAHNLPIRCYLNGEIVQDSNTRELIFKTDELIAWISRFCTLRTGDLILTGTGPGVGAFRKPPLWLKSGDVVVCEVEGIGAISNTIVR